MKFRFLFKIAIPVICLSVGLSARVNYQEMFLKANKFYKEGEFQSAYDLYKKIEIKSSQLHYNKGNCAYQLGKYGYALLYWRRAERSWGLFNRAELLDNIALLKHKINKSKPYKNITLLFLKKMKRYVSSLLRSTSLFSFQLLFLIFWVFLFLYLRYLYKNKQKIIIAILFFLIALFGTLLVIKYSLSCYQRGVVIKNNVFH